MVLDGFFTGDGADIRISAPQASRFAKEVAGDFNPLHDPQNKRFCVPGDLMFALVLARQGLSQRMSFKFSGMLAGGVDLHLPKSPANHFMLQDFAGKSYLEVTREGGFTNSASLVEQLSLSYVAFSGRNFPHALVPLMQEQGVMINTQRPMVIYESMRLEFDNLDFADLSLEAGENTLALNGKRGDVQLNCVFKSGNQVVGSGHKKLLLSGLRDYEADAMQDLVERYAGWKAAYKAA